MAKLIALFRQPQDPAAFDAYYHGTHVPLAKRIRGLRHYAVSTGPVVSPGGTTTYYLVASLTFDSMLAIQAGLASPEGQATGADLANFAQAGVELLVFDEQEI